MTHETLTHAFTTPQPIAWALASGHCPVWNSTTRPPLGAEGKLMGIHAGCEMPRKWTWPIGAPAYPADIASQPRGALVGVARLVGVIRAKSGAPIRFWRLQGKSACVGEYAPDDLADRIRPWWRGPWGWLLEEAVLLPEPIPMRGGGGMWRLPRRPPLPVPSYDEEMGAVPMTIAEWALEQWRKAREGR